MLHLNTFSRFSLLGTHVTQNSLRMLTLWTMICHDVYLFFKIWSTSLLPSSVHVAIKDYLLDLLLQWLMYLPVTVLDCHFLEEKKGGWPFDTSLSLIPVTGPWCVPDTSQHVNALFAEVNFLQVMSLLPELSSWEFVLRKQRKIRRKTVTKS